MSCRTMSELTPTYQFPELPRREGRGRDSSRHGLLGPGVRAAPPPLQDRTTPGECGRAGCEIGLQQTQRLANENQDHHRRVQPEYLQLPGVQQGLPPTAHAHPSPEVPQPGEAPPVHVLRQGLQRHVRPQASRQDAHGYPALQMQPVPQSLHTEMLPGVAPEENPWGGTEVQLQGEEGKALCL